MEEEIAPIMTITFSNEADADVYKTKLCEFIQTFPELNLKTVDNVTNVFKNSSISTEKEELNEVNSASTKLGSKKSRKKKKRQKDPVFFLDTQPSLDEGNFISISTGEVRKLGIEEAEEEPVKLTFGPTCFNCEGNHSLRDCPLPKDMAKINSNKQNHQKNRSVRYHLEDDLKFGHIHAGRISDNLRYALGLKKYELPPYIYKMRLIGYPPGWLEAAKLTSSDLLMYDGKGNTIKNQNAKKATGLDQEKIIRFPGFNAPLESGFKDEYRHYGVPKYNETQFPKQVEEYIKFAQSQIDDLETENMDIDETSDAESDDVVIVNLPEDKEIEAISLQELENQKNSILEEIKKSQETVPWVPTCETKELVVEENVSTNANDNEQNTEIEKEKSDSDGNTQTDTNDEEITEVIDLTATCTETEANLTLNNSVPEPDTSLGTPKATIMGTPIFKKTLSPYVQVPPLEHFREGVSQVINYENLPNTEGKYEIMRGVLQKIRQLKP
ncbi:unnamed protein product [Ceutorhynchus assimilis]|uniref:PSP proline-rich domain-containing protein n=1 Tax=Ceutorhynchus assimilis TaxID=467358 RepID=A0A9N9QS29_9CUCU|nr:unnamed protein product [Ceutorhynchus assimilis]